MSIEYPLHRQYELIGYQLEPETILQFVGGMNKFMDATVAGSISFLSAAYLSFGISREKGAIIADFDLADCMTNPFKAVYTIPRCCRQDEAIPKWHRIFNVVVRMLTSVCFILLPISINTLLSPKVIYHPSLSGDGFSQTKKLASENYLVTPMVYVNGISWDNALSKSSGLLGGTNGSVHLIAAQVLDAFYDLPMAFAHGKRDWYTAKRYPNVLTSIDTTPSRARGATVRAEDVQRLWHESKTYGPHYAKYAVGFWGNYNVSTPTVEVSCELNETVPTSQMGTLQFHPAQDPDTATTKVDLGDIPSLGFKAHTCSITTRHALYSVGAWSLPTYDAQLNASTALIGDNWAGFPFTYTSSPPGFAVNVHDPMISMLQETHPVLSALTSTLYHDTDTDIGSEDLFLHFLVQAANHLSSLPSPSTTTTPTPTTPTHPLFLPHLLTFWSQSLYTLSTPHTTTSKTHQTTSGPTWYQVYAAGPRLRWEFAILLVPCWLFAVLFVGVCAVVLKRVRLVACTDVSGMCFVRRGEGWDEAGVGVGSGLGMDVEGEMERGFYGVRVRKGADGALEVVR